MYQATQIDRTCARLTIGMLVCPRSGSAKRRPSSGSKLLANLIAGGKRREREHTNLLFDFLESRSMIFGSVY